MIAGMARLLFKRLVCIHPIRAQNLLAQGKIALREGFFQICEDKVPGAGETPSIVKFALTNLLMVAFGGGLTWGAAVVRWADIAKREHRSQSPRDIDLLRQLLGHRVRRSRRAAEESYIVQLRDGPILAIPAWMLDTNTCSLLRISQQCTVGAIEKNTQA
jgi:hypothetical protein